MADFPRIQLLPIHVANQIAAGEVVERPASVVKELMENAIDAGARSIDVVITQGGRTLISVADDGVGMDRENALMSLERQATSKIRAAEDIQRIATLGFRGEALASIASVSRFLLCTCRRDQDTATEITIAGGRRLDVRDAGRAAGTTVQVRDLFYNIPARRKFLRTQPTELAHIRTAFLRHALAHPECALTLRVDGRELLRLPGGATLDERIRDLFGTEYRAALRPLDYTNEPVRISGFIALPELARADNAEQFIFVNRRPASAAIIAIALREAYPPLERNRRPATFLFVDLPPDHVDVNVHPTKQEVRFRLPGPVRAAITTAVQRIFSSPGTHPETRDRSAPPPPTPPFAPLMTPAAAPPPPPVAPRLSRSLFRNTPSAANDAAATATRPPLPNSANRAVPTETAPPPATPRGPWTWCRVLGQIAGRYILLETDGGYTVLDPRAAHERILFERLKRQLKDGRPHTQTLLIPETVTLPPEDAERIRRNLERLAALGFDVREFGDGHFLVEALPEGLGHTPCRPLLIDLAHAIDCGKSRRTEHHESRDEALLRIAIRNAVQAHRDLDGAEIDALIRDLTTCQMPYTCPRGRPTMLFTSLRELARKFGRDS